MFRVVLYQPEIPPNTGNIIRLCANTGSELHLIEPLGFSISDRELRRAGLDYADAVTIHSHTSIDAFFEETTPVRAFMFSTKHSRVHSDCRFQCGDALVFGPETRGLPENVRHLVPAGQRVTLPMCTTRRSLNLSNAVAVALFEAWRQCGYPGSA
ncbi:MAG TPA: tRNA (uridine(34)/cytosine(34)/5-carboxymethylaminomethyluridine(34)-2'-O)-methyltransferase TrmL [Gammaproteobacteria bacterium]|jgi:tRNA (cytidine/uridine-2'-O-)-methyltransferase|nr:tRNA (uridine(34)/cytosine(34)/5-carboxymethylaminomethyluridine(34)-2'-O)-methyltransferase TrmL [Acidiferrobacteraceae bacterium]MDP6551645.1 tRNA (cytidine(34)-2'-O)-methyltransferase [Arenicellales bacterium]MDP6790629.1 tRNA (cytidine(34)-2'-O)-methyltransferase [Arenicellales bacterium]MDP6919193.1 tRNA (cytidine(34)-2'-O)-methyltransferase [Arenicellales bacterium]HCX88644.1 tRNA (uridine(34)/cytosine(34)/5-carboxymethylaminomethyluridine(34)-2'-O)-methyltransferase TrmL [Gammaproteob|tara:strand:+ start:61966 stop:62430 length:465 start_codon:yes stop_codon:yes gene_type:complete